MLKYTLSVVALSLALAASVTAQSSQTWRDLAGSALLDNHSYNVLERICDEAGGRLMGTPQNEKAVGIMVEELQRIGLQPKLEEFTVPGWTRGADRVAMTVPVTRDLRAKALGYVDKTPIFTADVVYAAYGRDEDYTGIDAKGKIVLVTQAKPPNGEAPLRYESIDMAASKGAKAILFTMDKPGGILMCGVGNFQGTPAPVPAYTITFEEGEWMKRLIERGKRVAVTIETESFCTPVESRNIVVTLPGKSDGKIVIGAHFDAWDVGNGGVDNGLGTAILYDVARLMKQFAANNKYTIEMVWFNGEELGLWGSRRYVERHRNENILAMINMDMTGTPTGFNAMGYDEFVPFFENLVKNIEGIDMSGGVGSNPWTNSDHMYFMFEGIPTFTLKAHLDKPMYEHYHDLGDTFDKVSKPYLSNAAAVVSILAYELANADGTLFRRHTQEETKAMLIKHKLDERLKRQKEWKWE